MKKLLLTAAALLAALDIYAQGSGSLTFTTVGVPNNKRVWVNNTGVVGEGTLAAGTAYATALYWGPAGTTDDRNLVQIGGSTTFLPAGASAGTYSGGGRTINYSHSPINGEVLSFQVRAWSTADGSSYEQVLASGSGSVGKGAIFQLKTKDEGNSLETKPNIADAVRSPGYTGFAITPVPEPSTIALGLLGVGTLLMLRRRK
jgi:PEP-CTERM motif